MESKGLAPKVLCPDIENPKLECFSVNRYGMIQSVDKRTAIESVFLFGDTDVIACRDMAGRESFIMLGSNTYTFNQFETKRRLRHLTLEDIHYLSKQTGLPFDELKEVYLLSRK